MHTTQQQDALARELAEDSLSAGRFDGLCVDQLSEAGQIDALVATERLVRTHLRNRVKRTGTACCSAQRDTGH